MNNDIRINLNYLSSETFKLLKEARELNADIIEMMALPKFNVTESSGEVDQIDLFHMIVKNSIGMGEHYDVVLATLFNVITKLQAAVYTKYQKDVIKLKIQKKITSLLETYCQTRRDCERSVVDIKL